MTRASLVAVEHYLPPTILSVADLAQLFPEWGAEKIAEKTGIRRLHVARDETATDLAEAAARKLFARGAVQPAEIDFVLFCTQTADHLLPSSACLLQHRLGIPISAGALDFSLGCSGFVYGLSLAKGLIETAQAKRVLLLTADTYSRILDPADKTVRTIFGDGGAAALVRATESEVDLLRAFVFGTDGAGAEHLICRRPAPGAAPTLRMNGPEVFNFSLRAVPDAVHRSLAAAGLSRDEIDLYVFHQANRYMLDYLRRKLQIPEDKFAVVLEDGGNTVSSTIPVALSDPRTRARLKAGATILLVGFGVGFSWAACVVTWLDPER